MNKMKYSLAFIDDEHVVRYALCTWFGKLNDFMITGSASHGKEGLELCEKTKPDIVILDINLSDINGFEVAIKLKQTSPMSRIIILSSLFDPFCIYKAAEIEIPGYVDKCSSLELLEVAVRAVASGEAYYAPIVGRVKDGQLSQSNAFNKILTPKELVLLILIVSAHSDEYISQKLGISINTVLTHRRNIHKKLNARNDRELIAYAFEWGLTPQKEKWIAKDIQHG